MRFPFGRRKRLERAEEERRERIVQRARAAVELAGERLDEQLDSLARAGGPHDFESELGDGEREEGDDE